MHYHQLFPVTSCWHSCTLLPPLLNFFCHGVLIHAQTFAWKPRVFKWLVDDRNFLTGISLSEIPVRCTVGEHLDSFLQYMASIPGVFKTKVVENQKVVSFHGTQNAHVHDSRLQVPSQAFATIRSASHLLRHIIFVQSLFCFEFHAFDSLERPHKLRDSEGYPPEHIISRCREQEKLGSTASTPLPSFPREISVYFVKNYSEQPKGTSVPPPSHSSSAALGLPDDA